MAYCDVKKGSGSPAKLCCTEDLASSNDKIFTKMRNIMKRIQKTWRYGIGRTALAAACAHSVSISVGICQGYSAILIPQLVVSDDFDITSEESSWLASLGAVTNPLGSILSGLLAEYFGRRLSIIVSSIPFLVGWLCIAAADNIWWLYSGRLITGIAAGMSTACYTYVAEISTPEHRGIFQALGPISASFGILLTYTLGTFLKWNVVALISISFSIFTLVSIQLVPESPAYLAKKDKRIEAFNSLIWFRRNNAVAQEEFDKYIVTTNKEKSGDSSSLKNVYMSSATVKPFIILVILFLLQELSGIYTILFYAVSFFQDSNLEIDEHISSIIVGVIRFVMSIMAAMLINKFGRKSLFMVSSGGMALSLLTAVVYFKYYEVFPSETKVLPFLPLISVLLNVLFSMVGMLPIPWILVGEMFPLQVRPIMCGFVICLAQCFIFICVKIYHDMNAYLNFSGTIFVFCISSVFALIFCKVFLPETKNKSLEEIEEHFKRTDVNNLVGMDNKGFSRSLEVVNDSVKNKNEIYRIQIKV